MRFATYKQLNLLKLKSILKGDPYLSFYHFNNINQAEWNLVKGKITNLLTSKSSSLRLEKKESWCFKEKEGTRVVFHSCVLNSKPESTRISQLWKDENQVRFLVVNSKKILKANPNKQVGKKKTQSFLEFLERDFNSRETGKWKREYKREFVERSFLNGPTLLVGNKSFQAFQNSLRELLKWRKLLLIGGFLEDSKINCLDLKRVIYLNPLTDKKEVVKSLTHSLCKNVLFFNQPFYNLISVLQLITTNKATSSEKGKANPYLLRMMEKGGR